MSTNKLCPHCSSENCVDNDCKGLEACEGFEACEKDSMLLIPSSPMDGSHFRIGNSMPYPLRSAAVEFEKLGMGTLANWGPGWEMSNSNVKLARFGDIAQAPEYVSIAYSK